MQKETFVYGRQNRRGLSAGKRAVLDRIMSNFSIDDSIIQDEVLEPSGLFKNNIRAVWLEIGFGAGEHIVAQALKNPDIGFIGCDPFMNGVASLCKKLDVEGLNNVKIYTGDAKNILKVLRPKSIQRLFILFPDPWPKKRHHKRRIINPETILLMQRIIVPGGELRIASDETSYIHWILRCMAESKVFNWSVSSQRDWQEKGADWPETRYEIKALSEGREPVFLTYFATGNKNF
ncbi:MAG: tRNA (guanosine(46)-N7)-methyltransferase TrmB [Alphaproteobacteria bacterium]|nr:tRNA (guanosine(46)-N7)-methyltransferase TrmB [Alphaproteobacteria bacterium]|tara:strand:+ start:607 stop:1308 length:702 start_codon:yes stop_codon:yes gene_type:complete